MKKLKLPARKTSAKPRRPKPAKTMGSWQLFRASLRDLHTDWLQYVKILGIVAIPSDILASIAFFGSDSLFSAVNSMVALFMNVALLWAIVRRQRDNHPTTVPQAYYDGSAAVLRFTLVSVALVIMLVPFAFGVTVYATTLFTPLAIGPTSAEEALVGVVALALAVPSFWLLVRYGLGPSAAVHDNLRPIAALRRSRYYTLGRFWPVAGRFVLLVVFLGLVSLPATLIALLLGLVKLGGLGIIVWELATTFISLPFANIYLMRLYRNLGETVPTLETVAATAVAEAKYEALARHTTAA